MPKILILMSDIGGGHRASAQALSAAFHERFGDRFQIDIIDLWSDHTPHPINKLPKVYGPIIQRGIWFWKFMWRISHEAWLSTAILRFVGLFVKRSMQRAYRQYSPDLVISVHPLMQEIPLSELRKFGSAAPFVTVVTDLATINPLWFHKQVARCYVASEEAMQRALRAHMMPEQMRLYGLPVRPDFAHVPRSSPALKQRLGLDETRRTVLLVGGGEGMGPVAAIARQVAQQLAQDARPAQMVVVCGRNEKLRRTLQKGTWPIPVHIQGFVTNMPEWMAVSDCIITKAGPGTIAEALICGLPILLSGYIPGQEEGNVPFVVDHGVGAYTEDPAEMAQIVSRWFGPGQDELDQMTQRAKALGHPHSSLEIVEDIASLLEEQRAHAAG